MADLFEGLELTPKQRAFVQHYIETNNAMEACRRAGYSDASLTAAAAKNMKHKRVQIALARHHAAEAKKHEVTREELIANLRKAYEMAQEANRPADMVAAVTALAKVTGLMIDRRHIQHEDVGQAHLDAIRELVEKPKVQRSDLIELDANRG